MSRSILAVVGLALLGAAFAGGWLLGSARAKAVAAQEEPAGLARDLAGLDDRRLPALEEWYYPGAKEGAGGGILETSETRSRLKVHFQLGRYRVLSTPDNFSRVTAFYEKKVKDALAQAGLMDKDKENEAKDHSPVGSGVTGRITNERCGGSIALFDAQGPRQVKTGLLGVRTQNYAVTAFVTQAEGEAQTHITLTHDRWAVEPLAR